MSTRYSAHGHAPLSKGYSHHRRDVGLLLRNEVDGKTADPSARDVMAACPLTVKPEDSIERVARLMSESDCGAVPVVDALGRLLGIITNRDITVRLIAKGLSIPHAQVSDCMTSEAFACSADMSLESCMRGMSWHHLSRMPIVDDEHRLIGMISQGDVVRYVCEHVESLGSGAMTDILYSLAY